MLISWQANDFRTQAQNQTAKTPGNPTPIMPFEQHARWEAGITWKSALNNLRLLIQPFIFWCLLEPWLHVFPIPGLKRSFFKLMAYMNDFRASGIAYAQLDSA